MKKSRFPYSFAAAIGFNVTLAASSAYSQSYAGPISEEMIFGAGTVVAYQEKCILTLIDPQTRTQVELIKKANIRDHRFVDGYHYGLQAVDMSKYIYGDLVCHALVSVVNAERVAKGFPPLFAELD